MLAKDCTGIRTVTTNVTIHFLMVLLDCFLFQMCSQNNRTTSDTGTHYKAVCRALVAEAIELISFLEKMAQERDVKTLFQNG